MFLTLNDFLAHFPVMNLTKEEFVKQLIVTYKTRPTLSALFNLESVIKTKDDMRYQQRDAIVDYFYDVIITHRHQYLTEFYKSYFELPSFYQLKWDNVNILGGAKPPQTPLSSGEGTASPQPSFEGKGGYGGASPPPGGLRPPTGNISLQKNDQSRRIIRNLNYLDILHHTRITNTCKSGVSFWQTFVNVYNHLQLEDRFFAPSSIGLFLREKNSGGINFNNFFYLFQQYQPKASILNPYTMNWIIKNLFSGTKIFTPVLSWASYLTAFMHSDWEHYVGVDVMSSVCDRCQFLFDYYQKELKPTLTNPKENRSSQ